MTSRDDLPDNLYLLASFLVDRSQAQRVIYVGCNFSEIPERYARPVDVICVDREERRAQIKKRTPTAEFISYDLELGLPNLDKFAEGSIIVCSRLVERLTQPELLLKELAKLSETAAYVLISTEDRFRKGSLFIGRSDGESSRWSIDEYARMLVLCGFPANILIGHISKSLDENSKNAILAIAGKEAIYRSPSRTVSVAAILHIYNEADIVGDVVRHLSSQGIEVHAFDNWSTDNTYQILTELKEQGLCNEVVRFPDYPSSSFDWTSQLRHTADYAAKLDAGWIIHNDADEIRIAPWATVGLRDAISFVDALGYSAIDFTVLNFLFVDEAAFKLSKARHFHFGRHANDRMQVKAWKNIGPVDLQAKGGHDAAFVGRKIYPLKFLSKHYPLRSSEQANRKIFQERLPRAAGERREKGWHDHYDTYGQMDFVAPWRRFELNYFDPGVFVGEFLLERLSGIGIEIEPQTIPNLYSWLAAKDRALAALQNAESKLGQHVEKTKSLERKLVAFEQEEQTRRMQIALLIKENDVLARSVERMTKERKAAYSIGTTVRFCHETARVHMGVGWSETEESGVWTDGVVAELICYPDAMPTAYLFARFRVTPFLRGQLAQHVDCFVNGMKITEWIFSATGDSNPVCADLIIPLYALSEEALRFRFQIMSPVSPSLIGISRDKRFLGFMLHEFSIKRDEGLPASAGVNVTGADAARAALDGDTSKMPRRA